MQVTLDALIKAAEQASARAREKLGELRKLEALHSHWSALDDLTRSNAAPAFEFAVDAARTGYEALSPLAKLLAGVFNIPVPPAPPFERLSDETKAKRGSPEQIAQWKAVIAETGDVAEKVTGFVNPSLPLATRTMKELAGRCGVSLGNVPAGYGQAIEEAIRAVEKDAGMVYACAAVVRQIAVLLPDDARVGDVGVTPEELAGHYDRIVGPPGSGGDSELVAAAKTAEATVAARPAHRPSSRGSASAGPAKRGSSRQGFEIG